MKFLEQDIFSIYPYNGENIQEIISRIYSKIERLENTGLAVDPALVAQVKELEKKVTLNTGNIEKNIKAIEDLNEKLTKLLDNHVLHSTRDLKMTQDDADSTNFNKLTDALKLGSRIVFDDLHVIKVDNPIELTNVSIKLEGKTSDCGIDLQGTSDRVYTNVNKNIELKNMKIKANNKVFLYNESLKNLINYISIKYCEISGGISVFALNVLEKDLCTGCKVNSINISNNTLLGASSPDVGQPLVRDTAGIFTLKNLPFDNYVYENNNASNFMGVINYLGNTNSYKNSDQLNLNRKNAVFRNNTTINDEKFFETLPTANKYVYHAVAVIECLVCHVDGNHTEGLKNNVANKKAVYDFYGSAVQYTYSNNTWINNVVVSDPGDTYGQNCLMKAKGGFLSKLNNIRAFKKFINNNFIVTKGYAKLTDRQLYTRLYDWQGGKESVCDWYIIGNTIKGINIGFQRNAVNFENFIFKDNHIEADHIYGSFVHLSSDHPIYNDNTLEISNNTIIAKASKPTYDFTSIDNTQDGRLLWNGNGFSFVNVYSPNEAIINNLIIRDNIIKADFRGNCKYDQMYPLIGGMEINNIVVTGNYFEKINPTVKDTNMATGIIMPKVEKAIKEFTLKDNTFVGMPFDGLGFRPVDHPSRDFTIVKLNVRDNEAINTKYPDNIDSVSSAGISVAKYLNNLAGGTTNFYIVEVTARNKEKTVTKKYEITLSAQQASVKTDGAGPAVKQITGSGGQQAWGTALTDDIWLECRNTRSYPIGSFIRACVKKEMFNDKDCVITQNIYKL